MFSTTRLPSTCCIVYVDPTILQLSMKRFGLYETTEWGILRHRFKWTSDVKNIHPRIRGMVR